MTADQLSAEDIAAGLFLFLYGLIGLLTNILVCWPMCQMRNEIVGFRFLLSQAITDILLMIQFGLWPGFVILSQEEHLPKRYRWHLHLYLDFMWWAMVYHYPIVAWSRFAAIEWPTWFRCLSHTTCALICFIPWITALTQSTIAHQFDWFKPLYYDARQYGLTTDWQTYNMSGTGRFYALCNVVSMILPFPLYGVAFWALIRRNKRHSLNKKRHRRSRADSTTMNILLQKQLSIESRLLIPCIINTLIFVFGQIFVTLCARYSGKWITWSVAVLFASNSFINPIIYLTFSSAIRLRLMTIFRKQLRRRSNIIYRHYECRFIFIEFFI
ncbi:unnamed protein product [Toxocara canis]|uniref:G_PROTEIN_RECEP_F1_2 domain-containing protein n=1 Tax=Toxocara canis TaxID=6265 RepID=A0A183UAL2_TOXCA|nr:unnamed protein product [Toxocara canis]